MYRLITGVYFRVNQNLFIHPIVICAIKALKITNVICSGKWGTSCVQQVSNFTCTTITTLKPRKGM